ncbi:MAG: hypothetical protein ACP5US_07555 [Candidatus Kryptoniota bacterium]
MTACFDINCNVAFRQTLHTDDLPSTVDSILNSVGNRLPGKTYLLTGSRNVYKMSLVIMYQLLKRNMCVVLVDGANRFELYSLTRQAETDNIEPYQILQKVFISRVFTAYQMDGLITGGVQPFMKQINSHALFIFGPLHTFYDDHVPLKDSIQSLDRIRLTLDFMKEEGVSIVIASEFLVPSKKDKTILFKKMTYMSNEIYKLDDESLKLIPVRRV